MVAGTQQPTRRRLRYSLDGRIYWWVVPPGPSVDSLGEVDDDSLRSAHRGHAPDALVLADAADQAVAVRGQSIEDRLEAIHFERQVAQSELIGHGGRRSRLVVWSDEARQFQPRTTV